MLTVFRAADLDLMKPWARRFDSIHVKLTGHTEAENSALQATIEHEYLECGCRAGRMGLAAAVLAVIAIAVLAGRPVKTWSSETWITGISAVVLSPMVVKLVSIIRARLRLLALIRDLQRPAS